MPPRPSHRDELQTLPGIGPSLAADLRALGVRRVADLERRDPERLYVKLNRLRGARQEVLLEDPSDNPIELAEPARRSRERAGES